MKNRLVVALLAASAVVFSGCAEMDTRQQSTLTGGAIGAGAGAIIGNQSGNPVTGAVVGGAAGALIGNQVGRSRE
ncbi:MAG: YMGG-like glycine zipper-containing protein [Pseudomonadota bacterium]